MIATMNERRGLTPESTRKKPRRLPAVFPAGTPPRFLLIFFSVPLLLIASAISGVAFSLKSPAYWLGGTLLWALWFAVMFMVITPRTDTLLLRYRDRMRQWAKVIFALILITGIVELVFMGLFSYWYVQSGADNNLVTVLTELQEAFRYNDGTALNQQAAENLLAGKNPYACSNVVETFVQHNGSFDRLTPLRVGRFANVFPYPTNDQLEQVWNTAILDSGAKAPPELESEVCYPAGSFLLPAPFIAMGLKDIRVVYFLFVLAGVVAAVWLVPDKRRMLLIGLLLISLEIWNIVAVGESGTIIFPFLLLAWVLIGKNNWLSAIFIGIAAATRQTAWFFLPFYLIALWHTAGFKPAAKAVGIMAGVFIAFSGYFMAADFKLWFESVASPMTAKMFPLGVGVVSLVTSGLAEITSSLPFTLMEFAVLAGAAIWFWRYGKKYPDAGPILAVLPLFFAWRSLWMYFFYVTIITCATMSINENSNQKLSLDSPSCPSLVRRNDDHSLPDNG
jgi:hypothetical protein